jgi:hypothetical protein
VRNAAWRLLLRVGADALPVSCAETARRLGIPVLGYAQGLPLLRAMGLTDHCRDNDGFAVHVGHRWCIFLSNALPPGVNRDFTLAHELGHAVLGHAPEERRDADRGRVRFTRANTREWDVGLERDDILERDANMLAARLLSPACVLWGLGLRTAEDIARVCGLPLAVARQRAARMALLYQRDLFLRDKTEQALFARFLPYLQAQGPLPQPCANKLAALNVGQ